MDPILEFTKASEFSADIVTLHYLMGTILIVRVILYGLLKDKKEINEIVVVVNDLLLLIVFCYFSIKQREYILDNFGYKLLFVWLLLLVLLVLNVKDIYSLIKSKSANKEKQGL
ncbi:hypothetical protein MHZ92_18415 [Sporosarcina sp. ACRSL]|uniref:hypothetical protein n=1 Tax=Sporosarcina sp. ACRSL TaxID=2918215 RepID=UPI001EF4E540|nr:hypothetical protein [Sporosarcina sp. ACRSL]MCG7346090.1 hypothetical protein [Sporosarcina sp. ACRSL]